MTNGQRDAAKIVLKVVAAALFALVTWAAARVDASKLDTTRFTSDSARREMMYNDDHALLVRIDRRLSALYCSQVPADQRPACN